MRIAITGVGGYLGKRIAQSLSRQHKIIPLVRVARSSSDRVFDLRQAKLPNLDDVDVLIHCAHDFSVSNWKEMDRVNVQGSLRLLRAAKRKHVHVIFISSIAAYDDCVSMYGRAKLAIERRSAPDVIIRPGLVYGGTDQGMFDKLVRVGRLAGRLGFVPLIKGIDAPGFYCHVDDLVRTVKAFLHRSSPLPVTAASPIAVSLRDVLDAAAQRKLRVIHIPYRFALSLLRTLEVLHFPVPFRSDGLVGMVHLNPSPDFRSHKRYGLRYRTFNASRYAR